MDYRYYDEGKWRYVSEEERPIATEIMMNVIKEGQKAYVVNHIGYKAYVEKDIDGELVWSLPCRHYTSEFYLDKEIEEELLWLVINNT